MPYKTNSQKHHKIRKKRHRCDIANRKRLRYNECKGRAPICLNRENEAETFMKILIVEDEQLLAESIMALLTANGFEAEAVYDGKSGLEYADLGIYDLVVLDVMLPELDGFQVAKRLRAAKCGTPILMLTARSGLEDRIEGLDAGADYYLAKPFDSRELLACVNALLRRQGSQVDELTFGNTTLDLSSGTLICGKENIRLSAIRSNVAIVAIRRLGYHLEVTTP